MFPEGFWWSVVFDVISGIITAVFLKFLENKGLRGAQSGIRKQDDSRKPEKIPQEHDERLCSLVHRGHIVSKGFYFARAAENISRIWRRSDLIVFKCSARFCVLWSIFVCCISKHIVHYYNLR